jgi:hypothetical protein
MVEGNDSTVQLNRSIELRWRRIETSVQRHGHFVVSFRSCVARGTTLNWRQDAGRGALVGLWHTSRSVTFD